MNIECNTWIYKKCVETADVTSTAHASTEHEIVNYHQSTSNANFDNEIFNENSANVTKNNLDIEMDGFDNDSISKFDANNNIFGGEEEIAQ